MKKLMIAFEKIEPQEGYEITFSSPEYWSIDGVRKKFDVVYAPNFPKIVEAYSEFGIAEYKKDEVDSTEQKPVDQDQSVQSNEPEQSEQSEVTEVSEQPAKRAGRKPKSKEE